MSRPSISGLTFVRELAFAVTLIIAPAAAPGSTAAAGLDSLIAQSKTESRLEIYSNVGTENWQGIVQAFNRKYPWIVVEALDLGPEESDQWGTAIMADEFIPSVRGIPDVGVWQRPPI